MTREQARQHINPKLLSDDLILLGDGDKITLTITDKMVDRLKDIEVINADKKDKPA